VRFAHKTGKEIKKGRKNEKAAHSALRCGSRAEKKHGEKKEGIGNVRGEKEVKKKKKKR